MELSLLRTFVPWNFHSREQKCLELSLPGTFAPGRESSKNFRSKELSLLGTFAPGSMFFGGIKLLNSRSDVIFIP